jgi:hypothetical protein
MQRLIDTGLVGAERPTALEHQYDLAGRVFRRFAVYAWRIVVHVTDPRALPPFLLFAIVRTVLRRTACDISARVRDLSKGTPGERMP